MPRAGVAWRLLKRPTLVLPAILTLLMVTMAIAPSLFTDADPRACNIARSSQPPSLAHLFGFDPQGCDYLANVIYGARPSIAIGVMVTVGSFVIAGVFGALAGYFGSWVDTLLSRLTDIVLGIPFILGAIVLLQILEDRTMFTVALAMVLFYWPGGLRYMRSSVLEVRNLEYVKAARVMGAGHMRILFAHVVPNSLTALIVFKTLGIGTIIAAEAALTFLGVGLQPPAISWGLQISVAKDYIEQAPHLLIFPAIFLSVTVLAFVMLGEALRDLLDPKAR